MNKLISLELKRNSLRSYHTGALISAVCVLALLYLLAVIPKLDTSEADIEIFMSYKSLTGIINILYMTVFMILSAVMSARFIVEEYTGKRRILLFSYPIKRRNILFSKIIMIFLYTVAAMFLCGVVTYGIFFITESFFPLCSDIISIEIIFNTALSLFCFSLITGVWSSITIWFGFRKQSATTTIIASVILSVVMCQIMFGARNSLIFVIAFLLAGTVAAALVTRSLSSKIENMEA